MRFLKTQQQRPHRSESGFTLIELLIAISILSFGLLAIGAMQIRAIQINDTAGDLTAGTTLAQDKLEDLMARVYTDPNLNDATAVGTSTTYNDANNPIDGLYTRTWAVDTDNPVTNTKRISVTVTWNDRGVTKTSTLTGIKARM